MKKALFSQLLFCCFLPYLVGQEPISVTLDFERDTLSVYSPWAFTLSIINTSENDVSAFPLRVEAGWVIEFGYIKLQIRRGEGSIWQNTNAIVSRQTDTYMSNDSYKKILRPMEKMVGEFYCTPPVLLINNGNIDVRVLYYPFGWGSPIMHNPAQSGQ